MSSFDQVMLFVSIGTCFIGVFWFIIWMWAEFMPNENKKLITPEIKLEEPKIKHTRRWGTFFNPSINYSSVVKSSFPYR